MSNQVTPPSGMNDPSWWSGCVIAATRAHIGDMDCSQYTDSRILDIFNAASFMVHTELCTCTSVSKPNFSVCHDSSQINPFQYPSFTALSLLKAACMVDQGEARAHARRQGLTAACGSAKLSIASGSSAYESLFKWGPCAAYSQLKEELCFLNPIKSATHCEQILSSFTSWDLNVRCCNTKCDC